MHSSASDIVDSVLYNRDMVSPKRSALQRANDALAFLTKVCGIVVDFGEPAGDFSDNAFFWFRNVFRPTRLPNWRETREVTSYLFQYRESLPSRTPIPSSSILDTTAPWSSINNVLSELFSPCCEVIPGIGSNNGYFTGWTVLRLYEHVFSCRSLETSLNVAPKLLNNAYVSAMSGAFVIYCLSLLWGLKNPEELRSILLPFLRVDDGVSLTLRPVDYKWVAYRMVTGNTPADISGKKNAHRGIFHELLVTALSHYDSTLPYDESRVRSALVSYAKSNRLWSSHKLRDEGIPSHIRPLVVDLYLRLRSPAHELITCMEPVFSQSKNAADILLSFSQRVPILPAVPLPDVVRTAIHRQLSDLVACYMIIFHGFGQKDNFWAKITRPPSTLSTLMGYHSLQPLEDD